MFVPGETYRRREIHEKHGGQQQGGISTPADSNIILLFTNERGQDHGYSDSWSDQNKFLYTGEGQVGDMTFMRGNKAIRDHVDNDKELHLFSQVSKGFVEYVGQMICVDYHWTEGPDTNGNIRKTIVFELSPVK